MNASNTPTEQDELHIDGFPTSLVEGSTILLANAGDPSQHAVVLRILSEYGTADDTAFTVTTTESADQTIETSEHLGSESKQPALRIVDTTSEQQSVSAPYSETPVVFTPSSGDLERLAVALAELSGTPSSTDGEHHLAIRSLTPILETTPTTRVCNLLTRITGLRSETGLCLLGIDYTAHDEETMAAISEQVDGVLWTTPHSTNHLELEYQPTNGRYQ